MAFCALFVHKIKKMEGTAVNTQDLAPYYFHQGTNFEAYKYLGCTLEQDNGKYRYTFRVWAPNADTVALVSDFTGWSAPILLSRITERGVYELSYISEVDLSGHAYKFRITKNGKTFDAYLKLAEGKTIFEFK